MMRVLLLALAFMAMAAVQPAFADEEKVTDDPDVSEVIAKANEEMSKKLVYDDIMPTTSRNAVPCTARGCKWPKRSRFVYVPVTISNRFSRAQRITIIRALVTFHRTTCIRFVWKQWWHYHYLNFYSGSGCWSYLGRQNRRGQPVSLQSNGCVYTSTIQHETLHALGFHHEQVRSDRDRYVQILTQNIRPGKEHNFRKIQTNNLGTPYDFDSVMHYSKYAFSRNGRPTIVARSDPNRNFGRSKSMTSNDIARVNRLYRCY